MSNAYLNRVFAVALTGAKKAVLITLADRANNSGYCHPSINDIAFRSGYSRRSVIWVIGELETLGFLNVKRAIGKPNKYILLIEKLSTADAVVAPQKVIHSGAATAQTRAKSVKKRCSSFTQTIFNPQEPYRARESGAKAAPVAKPDKKIINREMKHIRELLLPFGGAK